MSAAHGVELRGELLPHDRPVPDHLIRYALQHELTLPSPLR